MLEEKLDTNELVKDAANEISPNSYPNSNTISNPYLIAATSENTRKAYRADIKHYELSGGKLPATPHHIIQYLQIYAEKINSRTLSRRLIALKNWHLYQGFSDPTSHPAVKKTMLGITRIHGKPKNQSRPILPDDLQKMIKRLDENTCLLNIRDSALLQIGYFGALRRSEIIGLKCEHISWQKEGIEILIPSSKTDQTHEGQYCAIPYGHDLLCPVKALQNWLLNSHIKSGAVFRAIRKNNVINNRPLTPLSVNHIIKRCALLANLDQAADITPHSLRRGLATSAARANASIKTIMRAGRWKQVNTVMQYIEASERFSDSAAKSILQVMKTNT